MKSNKHLSKKIIGILSIILGLYLLIVNPIISMILNQITPSFGVQLDQLTYWGAWFMRYGGFTIFIAGIGVYLIHIGFRYIKKTD